MRSLENHKTGDALRDMPQNRDIRLLVCENEPGIAGSLTERLAGRGYLVRGENDADAILNTPAATRPDLILCDMELARLDSMAFLHRLRRDKPDLADVPFIVLSDYGDPSDVIAGKLAGADDYLVKPADIDLVVATIEAQLRQVRRMKSALARIGATDRATDLLAAFHPLMNRLSFGVVLFDVQSAAVFINRAAARLTGCDAMSIRHWLARHAGFSDHDLGWSSEPRFREADPVDKANLISLPDTDAEEPKRLFVTLTQLTGRQKRLPLLAVLIFNPGRDGAFGGSLVADAFGLTRAEAAVAEQLANGLRVEEIAQKLAVAKPTVNFHLRNIYQKTATARQAELITLMRCVQLDGPMPLA